MRELEGLATPEDLLMMGAAHQPPSGLNFIHVAIHKGEAVIVITSTRPMIDSELNIILKIQESGASHLKHIKQPIRQSSRAISAKAAANEKHFHLNILSVKKILRSIYPKALASVHRLQQM